MADLALVPRGTDWTFAGGTTTAETTGVSDDTALGDYIVLIGSVDYLPAAANPGAPSCPIVTTWAALAAQADPASGSTIMSIRAWLGKVTTAPTDTASRTITVPQAGGSGLHLGSRAYYGGSPDAVIGQDGAGAGIPDRATPYTHSTITPAGTRDLLLVAHGAVQFSGTALAYGDAPAGMTAGVGRGPDGTPKPYHSLNEFSGLQVCTQQLTAATATGTRDQTSNVGSLAGGAGVRFLLRSQGTVPTAPTGPEPGRMLLAV